MAIHIRAPREDEYDAMHQADGRAFGFFASAEDRAEKRGLLELDRFRNAYDGKDVVGTAGAYTFDLTMPGGRGIPVSGVTWVSCQATHRRQGIMTRMLDALHADAVERGEPAAVLTASESAIYGRFGYGNASQVRIATIVKREARLRDDVVSSGKVWYEEPGDALRKHLVSCYERALPQTPGEITRNDAWWDYLFTVRTKESGGMTPTFFLCHEDGYACYRVVTHWNDGHPAHRVELTELVAVTEEARAALWRTILSMDLVGEIGVRFLPLDDPLVLWLENSRAIRTTTYNDWLWLKPLDVAALLRSRTYGTDDHLVVEVGDARFSIQTDDGQPTVRKVRTRPDVSTNDAGLGALLLGGVTPSQLARAGLLRAGDAKDLRRADTLFSAERLPSSQTGF